MYPFAAGRIIKSGVGGQIGRTKPVKAIDHPGCGLIAIGGTVPYEVSGGEICTADHLEIGFVDYPLGHKRASRPMRSFNAIAGTEFVVDQHGERAVAVVASTEAIRDTDHLVAIIGGIARGNDGRSHASPAQWG